MLTLLRAILFHYLGSFAVIAVNHYTGFGRPTPSICFLWGMTAVMVYLLVTLVIKPKVLQLREEWRINKAIKKNTKRW